MAEVSTQETQQPSTTTSRRIAAMRRKLRRVPRAIKQSRPEDQARWLLRTGFIVAPLVAGADKFFNRMCNWESYLAPQIKRTVPLHPRTFMYGVGIIEMAAGVMVARRPKVGAYVVSGWLAGI